MVTVYFLLRYLNIHSCVCTYYSTLLIDNDCIQNNSRWDTLNGQRYFILRLFLCLVDSYKDIKFLVSMATVTTHQRKNLINVFLGRKWVRRFNNGSLITVKLTCIHRTLPSLTVTIKTIRSTWRTPVANLKKMIQIMCKSKNVIVYQL